MKFDKETLFAFIVCLAILFAWPYVSRAFGGGRTAVKTAVKTAVQAPVQTAAAPAVQEKAAQPPPVVQSVPVVLKNDDLSVEIDPVSGAVVRESFLRYDLADRSALITLEPPAGSPGLFQIFGKDWQLADNPVVKKLGDSGCIITRNISTPQGNCTVQQKFTLESAGYVSRCAYTITNTGKQPLFLPDTVVCGGGIAPWHSIAGDKLRTASHRMDYLTTGGDYEDIDGDKKDEKFFVRPAPELHWAAVSNKYFCSIFDAAQPFTLWQNRCYQRGKDGKEFPVISVGAALPVLNVKPGEAVECEFRLYRGPKVIDAVKAFDPGATKVMHLAWGPLNYLARFLLWLLTLFHQLCGSYGWSIVILTLLVRAVFYPITARSNEAMKKMTKVQPKFKELREKYKDNPALLNQKMSELYRAEGVNPFAGCLPILLQIPIFFALYAMLDNAIELRHVSFFWCQNLAAADTVALIPIFSWNLPINPLVLVMTALMVIQQRMTPMAMDPAQQKMMILMPVIMLIFLYDLPSGLTLYWTVSNLFSIIQLWLQKRRGQTPVSAAPGTTKGK